MNKSAARAIEILELMARNKRPMTLTEIGKSLSLPKSSCFELVYTLVEHGVLEVENEAQKTFRLGIKLFQMGSTVLSQTNLYSIAHPLLHHLARTTGETVYLAIEEKDEIVYMDKVESDEPIRSTLSIGSRNSMTVTGLGKSLLATYTHQKLQSTFSQRDFPVPTPYSLKSFEALQKDIEGTRKRGYAIDDREGMEFLRCVAAPVRDHNGKAIAAISIAALDSRLPQDKLPEFGAQVVETAMEISRRLGYIGSRLYPEAEEQ